jgi:hypothetical protein
MAIASTSFDTNWFFPAGSEQLGSSRATYNPVFTGGIYSTDAVRYVLPAGAIKHENDGSNFDSYGLYVRIMSGATVLAAANSGGTKQAVVAEAAQADAATLTNIGPSEVVFAWFKTDATQGEWNAATIEWDQTYSQSMGNDSGRFVAYTTGTIEITYTPSSATTSTALNFTGAVAGDTLLAFLNMSGTSGFSIITAWTNGGALSTGRHMVAGTGTQAATLSFGGYNSGALDSSEEYNGASWSAGGTLNNSVERSSGAGTQSAALLMGGYWGSKKDLVEEYNGTTWSTATAINLARHSLAGCGTQSAALCFGGNDNSPEVATESYNGTSWTTENPMVLARHGLGGAGTQGSALSFGGYFNSTSGDDQTDEYDGTSWTAGGNLITRRQYLAGCGLQGAALSFGGATPAQLANTEAYNGTSWAADDPLTTARYYLGGAGTQAAAVSFGGNSSKTTTENYGSAWTFIQGTDGTAVRSEIWKKESDGTETTESWTHSLTEAVGIPVTLLAADTHDYATVTVATANTGTSTTPQAPTITPGQADSNTVIAGFGTEGDSTPFAVAGGVWASGGAMLTTRDNTSGAGTQTATLSVAGRQNTTDVDDTDEYNGATWSNEATFPVVGYGIPAAGTQTAAVAATGNQGTYSANCDEYNGTTWTGSNDAPTASVDARMSGTQSAALLFGGRSATVSPLPDTEEYNGSTWSAGGDLSTARYAPAGAGTQTAALCISGTASAGLRLTSVEEYDGTSWAASTALSVGRSSPSGFGTATAATTTGGNYSNGNKDLTEDFNGTTWSASGNAVVAHLQAGSAGTQSAGIVFGGDDSGDLDNTQEYSGPSGIVLEDEDQSSSTPTSAGIWVGIKEDIAGASGVFNFTMSPSNSWVGFTVSVDKEPTSTVTGITEELILTTNDAVVSITYDVVKEIPFATVVLPTQTPKFKTKPYKKHDRSLRPSWSRSFLVGYAPTISNDVVWDLDRTITGTTEALTLTTNDATVVTEAPRDITGTTEALTLTTNDATVVGTIDRTITGTSEALTLTTNDAVVVGTIDRTITGTTEALTLTENQATIQIDRTVTGDSEALLLTENQALVAKDRLVVATTEALTLGTNQAAVDLARSITASSESLLLTTLPATVIFGSNDLEITGTTEALTLTTNTASIQTDRLVTGATEALLLTENQATVARTIDLLVVGTTEALTLTENQATVDILLSLIVSVVPASFPDGTTGVVITTQAIDTSSAVVYIRGDVQTITGTTANSITITTVRGTQPVGATHVVVVV